MAPRRLHVERQGARGLVLTYRLDAVGTLQALLAPGTSRSPWLQRYARLGEGELARALAPALSTLQAQTRLISPHAGAVALSAWEWPAPRDWLQAVQDAAMLLQATGSAAEHAAEVGIQARATVPPRAARLMLRVPAPLHPLLVVHGGADAFWLTDALPSALLDL